MKLGVDVSEACVEDGEDVLPGQGQAIGVEFEDDGGGGGVVVVGGWGEMAGDVSESLAIQP